MAIGIINLGISNISSVKRMIESVGADCSTITQPIQNNRYSKYILPGVGNFNEGSKRLFKLGFNDFLREEIIEKEKPILGICLGMHMLCRKSEEGNCRGLEFIKSNVIKFKKNNQNTIKIPNMGWSKVFLKNKNSLISEDQKKFYFVHSYYVDLREQEQMIATAEHGHEFCAAFQKDNIYGVQFHPEKSHQFGLSLMKNFVKI